MARHASSLCAALLTLCVPLLARAQETTEPPAHISYVDGVAVLERDGRTDTAPASMPLLAGDRVRTENGRLEVLFADGSTLHLDASTVIDVQSNEVIRLLQGRIRLSIAGRNRAVAYRVDAPGGWVQITQSGEYRVAVLRNTAEAEVELAVLRGAAELINEDGRTELRAGERAFARSGAAPSYAYVFNSAAWDAFDRWSEARRDQRLGVSTQYLPDTVRPYGPVFDRYGSWQYDVSYGYVWYPTVHVGWRPYYYGRWATLRPFGWTWIGADPWAWPTHHFGRWGVSAGVWFWIPGRIWGPAWVSWAYAPGYVGWCPLGWNNRPLVQIVNVFGGRHNPWHAWTVVPRHRFGSGFVNVHVVAGSRIDARTRGAFAVRDHGPDFRGYAVPRSSAPIYVAGTRSVGSINSTAAFGGRTPGPSRSAVSRDAGATAESVGRSRDNATTADQSAAEAFRRRGQPGAAVSRGIPDTSRAPSSRSSIAPGSPSSTDDERATVNRAVPRTRGESGIVTPPSSSAAPGRRLEVPGYRRAPTPPAVTPDSGSNRSAPDSAAPERSRAVPRGLESSGGSNQPRGFERSSPRSYSVTPPDPGSRRVAPDAGSWTPRPMPRSEPAAPRAMPRSAPEGPPPPANRSAPGAERPASPSGPPPGAAAPARPSGPPAAGAPAGRSRSGGESTGTAVRRKG
jgi:hypothetical protein